MVGEVAGHREDEISLISIWRIEERCGLKRAEHVVGGDSVIVSATAPAFLAKLWNPNLPASIKLQSFRCVSVVTSI